MLDCPFFLSHTLFAHQNHPNGLFTCKMSNSYLLKANTLKNMNKDLNLAILLIPVANFRHQCLHTVIENEYMPY